MRLKCTFSRRMWFFEVHMRYERRNGFWNWRQLWNPSQRILQIGCMDIVKLLLPTIPLTTSHLRKVLKDRFTAGKSYQKISLEDDIKISIHTGRVWIAILIFLAPSFFLAFRRPVCHRLLTTRAFSLSILFNTTVSIGWSLTTTSSKPYTVTNISMEQNEKL